MYVVYIEPGRVYGSASLPRLLMELRYCVCPLGGDKEASDSVCGEPPHPELVPHDHRHPVLLPAAAQRGPRLLQNDPHPGLHRVPAHHERPAAQHGQRNADHRSDTSERPTEEPRERLSTMSRFFQRY